MNKYRVNASLEMVGGFWTSESPNEVIAGTISSVQGDSRFKAAPAFKVLGDDALKEAFHHFNNPDEAQQIETLCGFVRDGRCTLLGVHEWNGDGTLDLENKHEIIADQYLVETVVMGLHLKSSKNPSIDSASFYFTKTHNWLPTPWGFQIDKDGLTRISTKKPVEVFRFSSLFLRAEIICEVLSEGSTRVKKGTWIESVSRIKVIPQTAQSLNWFSSLAFRLENFFTLFLGTSVSLKRLQLFQGPDEGWLVRKMRIRNEKINVQAWVRCSHHQIARALATWLSVPDGQLPVEKTVLGMMRKSSLFVETEFLALAQALEGFGRTRFDGEIVPPSEFRQRLAELRTTIAEIWGDSEIAVRCNDSLNHANQLSYAQLVWKTCNLLSADFSLKLLEDQTKFVQTVVQTRNYFTHLGIKKGSAVADEGKKLFLLNQRLHALIRCVMLLELGIAESDLREPILYQAKKWR